MVLSLFFFLLIAGSLFSTLCWHLLVDLLRSTLVGVRRRSDFLPSSIYLPFHSSAMRSRMAARRSWRELQKLVRPDTTLVGLRGCHLPRNTLSPFNTPVTSCYFQSDAAVTEERGNDDTEPIGDLLKAKEVGPSLVGLTAQVKRTFGPRDNAQAMLTCGGEALAAHASFDPDYERAKTWVRHHAVGPAVLSPVLISGLTGALVEAAFPQAIIMSQGMSQIRPLIVGVPVIGKIEASSVIDTRKNGFRAVEIGEGFEKCHGYQVDLKSLVLRVRDDAVIAEGVYSIWIPDYEHM